MEQQFVGTPSREFVLAKPITQQHYEEELIHALLRKGRLIITRKRDGWKLFAGFDENGEVRLYTDGMNEVDDRLGHLKKDLRKLRLKNALLVGEILGDDMGKDVLGNVISVMQSKTEKALATQKERGPLKYMVFNIVFLDGKKADLTYREVLQTLDAMFRKAKLKQCFRVPVLDMGFEEAKALVESEGWEGLVLYDADFRITFRLDGKDPERTKGCYKWKPIMEDDFIVRARVLRPDSNTVKEVELWQIDPVTRKEFRCGMLGSFTNAMRKELATVELPIVMQVRFDERFAKTGKFRHGRFMRIRTDKRWQDCISPESFPAAEHASKVNEDGTRKA